MKLLSVPHSVPLFTTSTLIAPTLASLEVTEPTKRFWQSRLQQQASRFTDDTGFTVDLPSGWITYDYSNIGPDAK